MKLTGQQLDALVSKCYDAESKTKEYNAAVEKAKKDPKNKALAKKYHKTLMSIPEKIRKSRNYGNIDMTEYEFLNGIVKTQIKEPNEPSTREIKNRILIASIDSETMNELQNKLKLKF